MNNAIDARVEERVRTVLIVDDFQEDRRVYQRHLLQDEEWRDKMIGGAAGGGGNAPFPGGGAGCGVLDYPLPHRNREGGFSAVDEFDRGWSGEGVAGR